MYSLQTSLYKACIWACILYMAPLCCINCNTEPPLYWHTNKSSPHHPPPCMFGLWGIWKSRLFSNYLCVWLWYNLARIVAVILLMICSGISISVFNMVNSVSHSRDFWQEEINGCIVATIVSFGGAHGHSKLLEIVFLMFKRSQRHVKKSRCQRRENPQYCFCAAWHRSSA